MFLSFWFVHFSVTKKGLKGFIEATRVRSKVFSLFHRNNSHNIINICHSPAARSVLGETVPEVSSTARGRRPRAVLRPRAQFLPIRINLGRWITFLFFSYWDLKVSGKFYYSLEPMFVVEGGVRGDVIQSAQSIANQNKTLQHDFYLVICIIIHSKYFPDSDWLKAHA